MQNSITQARSHYILLAVLSIAVLFIDFAIFDEDLNNYYFVSFLNITITMSLVIYSYFLIKQNEIAENKLSVASNVLDSSPLMHIYSKDCSEITHISENLKRFITVYSIENISSLEQLFDEHDWLEITSSIKSNSKDDTFQSGAINLEAVSPNMKHIQYFLKTALLKNGQRDCSICFLDISSLKSSERQIIEFIHKYRNFSFALDQIFNNLPFPVWKRTSDGLVEYTNRSFDEFFKNLQEETTEKEAGIYLQEFFEDIEFAANTRSIKKNIIVGDAPKSYSFFESQVSKYQGYVGHCLNTTDFENLKKKWKSQNDNQAKLLDIMDGALLHMDDELNLLHFNKKFIELFSVDLPFMLEHPTLEQILDHIAITGNLKISSSYVEFKCNLINNALALEDTKNEILHLTDGSTLELSINKIPNWGIVLMWKNFNELLKLKEEVAEIKSTLDELLETQTIPAIIVRRNGKVGNVNSSFTQLSSQTVVPNNTFIDEIEYFKKDKEDLKGAINNAFSTKTTQLVNTADKTIYVKYLPNDELLLVINQNNEVTHEDKPTTTS